MKRLFTIITLMAAVLGVHANDGSYYVSGYHLVPLTETQIAITREVLTINIGDDNYASVDVLYEMDNRGDAKTITMGFEALIPYNAGAPFSPQGIHPFIQDFSATINDQALEYSNAVVMASNYEGKATDFKPLDMKKWRLMDEEEFDYGGSYLVNGKDTINNISYAYYFKAAFKPGRNIVHHTYRYRMADGVGRVYEVPYSLTPCTRWANGQVDDFTLKITAKNTAKHFFIYDDVFRQAPFIVVEGTGKVRTATMNADYSNNHYAEVSLRNGAVQCHVKNFKPTVGMCIHSADLLIMEKEGLWDAASTYDRGGVVWPRDYVDFKAFYGREAKNEEEEMALVRRIWRNLPYANRGYVFKDKLLQEYFKKVWWYMPDPNWQMTTEGFTRVDWMYINDLGNESKKDDQHNQ